MMIDASGKTKLPLEVAGSHLSPISDNWHRQKTQTAVQAVTNTIQVAQTETDNHQTWSVMETTIVASGKAELPLAVKGSHLSLISHN